MELQEFITKSLVQIIQGVTDAQEQASKCVAKINPEGLQICNGQVIYNPGITGDSENKQFGQSVEFDMAVTSTDTDQIKGGIGVLSAIIGFGAQVKSQIEDSAVSRIKFSVPLFLPQQQVH